MDLANIWRLETQMGCSQQERGVGHTNGKMGGRREGLDTGNGEEPAQEGRHGSWLPF